MVDCPICLCSFDVTTTTRCGHTFCSKCLDRWTTDRQDCPLCRAPLLIKTEMRITVFRKCLRKYLKGYTMVSHTDNNDAFVKHLEQNVFCFEDTYAQQHRMSRNYVLFEYASNRFQVSFKYLNPDLRSRLFGRTKEEQARAITATVLQSNASG